MGLEGCSELSSDQLIDMYRKMVTMRLFDAKICELFAKGLLPGFIHTQEGHEAVAVGIYMALRKDDYVVTTHRNTGHCIAKGVPLNSLIAELFAKETGCCKGRGGQLQLTDFDRGILSISIVGSGIPLASGIGLSIKLRNTDQVVVCFFGDGASNTGQFHESLNMAALWKLPVIFVCENNLYAMSVPVSKSTSVKDIATRAVAYNIPGIVVDGMDVCAVFEVAQKAVERARKKEGPTLIECKTYRFGGHFYGDDTKLYRSEEEVEKWKKKDPISNFKAKLIDLGVLTEEKAKAIDQKVTKEIEEAVKFALESPALTVEEAMKYVYEE